MQGQQWQMGRDRDPPPGNMFFDPPPLLLFPFYPLRPTSPYEQRGPQNQAHWANYPHNHFHRGNYGAWRGYNGNTNFPQRGPSPQARVSPAPGRQSQSDSSFYDMNRPLPERISTQIEFYFSDANLIRDFYLKSKMDNEGWVPISVIAGFYRIMMLTRDVHVVLNALKLHSTEVEVQDFKVRKRNGWMNYVTIPRPSLRSASSSQSSLDLQSFFQQISLDEATLDTSGEESQLPNGGELTRENGST